MNRSTMPHECTIACASPWETDKTVLLWLHARMPWLLDPDLPLCLKRITDSVCLNLLCQMSFTLSPMRSVNIKKYYGVVGIRRRDFERFTCLQPPSSLIWRKWVLVCRLSVWLYVWMWASASTRTTGLILIIYGTFEFIRHMLVPGQSKSSASKSRGPSNWQKTASILF